MSKFTGDNLTMIYLVVFTVVLSVAGSQFAIYSRNYKIQQREEAAAKVLKCDVQPLNDKVNKIICPGYSYTVSQ